MARKTTKSAKIRQFCSENPDLTGVDVLKALKMPITASNKQAVYGARNYLNKHGEFTPAEPVRERKQRVEKQVDPKLQKFHAIATVCMKYGTTSVISVAKAMMEAEKKL